MKESAIYLEPIAQAQARLKSLISERQSRGSLSPVTVIVPRRYAALFLRRNIGQRGLANVRFMVMPQLTELLGGQAVAARGLRPLSPMIEYEAVRIAASKASGALAQFREHQSFHTRLQTTFRELRRAEPAARGALARSGGLSSQIVELYEAFLDHTKEYYTSEDIAAAAAESVRGGHASMLSELGPVIVYLVHNFSRGEKQMLDALMSAWSCAVVLGVTDDEEANGAVRRMAASFSCPIHQERVARETPDDEARLSIASDAREEIRSIARDIAADARRGVPFHRMAVLYWQQEPYAALIADQFALAKVPMSGPQPQKLAATTIGRIVGGVVDLADGNLSRDDVMRWLTSCPIKYGRRGFSASRWDAVSRDAGVVKGLDQWRNRLDHHAERMKRAAQAADDEVSDERRRRMARDGEEALDLQAFITKLHTDLAAHEDGRSWTDFVDWARRLIDEYLDTRALPESEEANRDEIQTKLDELRDLDHLGSSPTLGGFRAVLDKAMSAPSVVDDGEDWDAPSARTSELGEGVFVGPVEATLGMRFDKVYFVGMVEGQVPPRVGGDPLLPERERERAGLPLRHDPVEERYKYLAAAAGQARALSFPRNNNASLSGQHPSRWFLEEATRIHGSRVSSKDLTSMTNEPWLNVIASAEDAIEAAAQSQPADLHDYDMHKLWLWLQRGNPFEQHHLAAPSSLLDRAVQMERARTRSRVLTIWDGDLSSNPPQSTLIYVDGAMERTNKPLLSATRLEMWVACPYRYFLSYHLGIAAPERPEEVASITPLDRGLLVHAILERFIREARDGGTAPEPDESWDEGHRRLLDAVADREFRDAERRGVTGKDLLWEMARAEIRRDLHTFLDADSEIRKTHGVSPHSVELKFEFEMEEGGCADPPDERNNLRFRGVIDRIDVSLDGKTALVLDYKTGGTTEYTNMTDDPVRRGTRLQLPVYALAAQQMLGSGVDVKAAYWFVSSRGKFATRPQTPVRMDEMQEPFTKVVKVIKAGIRHGLFPANKATKAGIGHGEDVLFPANPGMSQSTPPENCKYCDFDKICPPESRRVRTWERKRKNDPRLADYLSMVSGGGEEDSQ